MARRVLLAFGVMAVLLALGPGVAWLSSHLTSVTADAALKDGKLYYSDGTLLADLGLGPTPTPTPAPTPTPTAAPTATPTPTPTPVVLTNIPLQASAWMFQTGFGYPDASISFDATGLTISIPAPGPNQYPRGTAWVNGFLISPGQPYVLEAEARRLGDTSGNFLVGVNIDPDMGTPANGNFFQHWHLGPLQASPINGNFYGDWSDSPPHAVTTVLLDEAWHTLRIEYDGADTLREYFDGVLIQVIGRTRDLQLLYPGDRARFRLYAEGYEGSGAKQLQVRRFSVKVG